MILQQRLFGYADKTTHAGNGITTTRLPLTDMPDETIRHVYAYWRSKRRAGMLPARADIDPADFPWALGFVCLIDVEREPASFRYRLDGSIIADCSGADLTGRTTDDVRPSFYADMLYRHFSDVAHSRAPSLYEIIVRYDGEARTYRRLAMPLAADGRTVDMIMTVSQQGLRSFELAGPCMR